MIRTIFNNILDSALSGQLAETDDLRKQKDNESGKDYISRMKENDVSGPVFYRK
jgi:hypothetical protein